MSERLDGQVTLVVVRPAGGKGSASLATGGACGRRGGRTRLEFARELGPKMTADTHTEVAVEDDVAAAIDLAVERFGRLDCVVNNVGILGAVGSRADDLTTDYRRRLVGC